MKVIGAGFGRTGTLSLKVALETLGFGPCYHMTEVFKNPQHLELWYDAALERPVDWPAMFHRYQAAVDWPACAFYQPLVDVFPDAKVILTVRDPERWYESALETIHALSQTPPVSWTGWMIPGLRRFIRNGKRIVWKGTFKGRFLDRPFALEVYRRHIEEVTRYVAPERLLVYDVKEGWEPLCRFLEVPVPAQLFPRLNDAAEFRKNILKARFMACLVPMLWALLAGSLLYGLVG